MYCTTSINGMHTLWVCERAEKVDFESSNSQNISKSKREKGKWSNFPPLLLQLLHPQTIFLPFPSLHSPSPSSLHSFSPLSPLFHSPPPFFAHSHLPLSLFPPPFFPLPHVTAVSLVQVSLLLIGQQGLGLISSGIGPCFSLTGGLCKFYANAGGKRPIQR